MLSPGSWGEYECKASNNLGHASATTSITGALLCDDRDDDHDDLDDHGIMMKKDHYDIDYTQTTTGWAKEATVTLTAIPASMSSHQASI